MIVNGQRRDITPGLYVLACGINSGCQLQTSPVARVPNRTKVVRLIVVPDAIANKPAAVRQLAEEEGASKSDVFIVGTEPKSYLGGQLVEHEKAIYLDDSTVVFVMVEELEQVQWESNVEFEITDINKKQAMTQRFDENEDAPKNPFALEIPTKTGPHSLFRSGVAHLKNHASGKGQLYKVSFRITIDGKPHNIDPDVYCDM